MFCCLQLAACVTPTPRSDLDEAVLWYTGAAGHVDETRARALLEQAARTGYPLATMWMARVHSTGRMGFAHDKTRARHIAETVITQVEKLAENGNSEAAFLMGTAHAEGLGRDENPEAAAAWYRKAAAQGHMLASHNLGNAYAAGTGVEQDDAMAVHWWQQAADDGDAIPQYMLGTMYEQGRGVSMDPGMAARWYREAASRGEPRAMEALQRLAD